MAPGLVVETVTVDGLREAVAPAIETVEVTTRVPVYPLRPVNVITELPDEPDETTSETGLADTLKSAAGVTFRAMVTE